MENKNSTKIIKLPYTKYILTIGLIIVLLIYVIFKMEFPEKDQDPSRKDFYKVGIISYNEEDTYVSTVINHLTNGFKEYEKILEEKTLDPNGEINKQIRIDISYSRESQSVQNSQVENYLSLNYDLLIVNMVDRTEAATVIDKAMAKDTPIIFYNREPVEEDMKKWDKIYYIGFNPEETAKLQSEIILDYYEKNKEVLDKNSDDIIQYIILEGESRHQDSLIRTEKCIESLIDGGMNLERLQGAIANWSRTQAGILMENFFNEYKEKIELVICNNDDMALGVIDVVVKNDLDFNKIVGIDGTPQGLEAVNNNQMIGTVDINAKDFADVIISMTLSLLNDREFEKDIKLVDNIYVWVDQKKIIGDF